MIIDLQKIQNEQKDFLTWLESREGLINPKHKFEITTGQILATISELYEVGNEVKTLYKWWDKSEEDRGRIIEELSDLLSHICNIANQLEVKLIDDIDISQTSCLESQFLSLTGHLIQIPKRTNKYFIRHKIEVVFREYIQLIYSLGFSIDELEEAYMKKIKINYSRFE